MEQKDIISAAYRITIGSILIFVSIMEVIFHGLEMFIANETLVATQFGAGMTLIGAGLFKKPRKRDERYYNEPDEPNEDEIITNN